MTRADLAIEEFDGGARPAEFNPLARLSHDEV
jgi:hypothetical protein